jgi:predicted hotdog family 3-hydroxylacyl-ACP dehydratase
LIKFPTLSEFYEEVAPWPIVKVPRAAQAADRVEVRGILAGSERAEVAANKVAVDQEVAKAVRVEVGRAAVAGKAAVAARVDQEAVKRVVVVREVQGEAKAGRAEGVGKAGRGARTARL